ncbi:MAG: TVP38/TMEM64 family protein [Candidatus Thermoplasmatota archaeon]|nr:TVP38/TMEM64 family protein [Candidatus Thermoplasmatota archaeon]
MELNYKKIIFTLFLLIGIIFAIINRESFDNENINNLLENYGSFAPFIFIFIYALATVLFLPGLILTILAGALFGPFFGTIYAISGATLGATLAFLNARYISYGKIEKMIEGSKLEFIKKSVEEEGWKFVAFTRLVPLFPFNLLNYSFGLTKIKLSEYIWSSFLFMIPGTLGYVYLGFTGTEIVTGGENIIQTILILIAILVTVMYLPHYIKKVSKMSESID